MTTAAATHTPGPWKRDGRLVYAVTPGSGPGGGHYFVNVFSASVQDSNGMALPGEMEAVARLMAAAPDLLAAAQAALGWIEDGADSKSYRLVDTLRAAIEKAS